MDGGKFRRTGIPEVLCRNPPTLPQQAQATRPQVRPETDLSPAQVPGKAPGHFSVRRASRLRFIGTIMIYGAGIVDEVFVWR